MYERRKINQNTKNCTCTEHHLCCVLKEKGTVEKKTLQILTDAYITKKAVLEEMSSDKIRRCSKTFCRNELRTCKMEIIILFLASEVP